MELERFYAAVGGDYEQVRSSIPGDAMLRRFLKKFPGDPAYAELKAAIAEADLHTAFRAAHTLKGTAATLGLDALAHAAAALTESLRAETELPPQELVSAADGAYETAICWIGRLDG